jgi:hypothetical protein
MVLTVIVIGMLLAYYVGFGVGRREGYEQGHRDGKRDGSIRAYAVGYDRGRHDRQAKATPADEPAPAATRWSLFFRRWLLPVLVSLLAIVIAAVLSSLEKHPQIDEISGPPGASKLGLR